MTFWKSKRQSPKVSSRTSDYVPGDMVRINITDPYFAEYKDRHGVVIYGPDDDQNPGWIVSSAPGSIRCVGSELTMIIPREERTS
jgi:hypothetical protein